MIKFGDETDNFLDVINHIKNTVNFVTPIRTTTTTRKSCKTQFIFNIATPKIPIIININEYSYSDIYKLKNNDKIIF